jgi:hypothetical protein
VEERTIDGGFSLFVSQRLIWKIYIKLPFEGNNLKSILDAEGITYYIQGEHVAPFVFHSVPMRLMVRKDQAAKVRELLKDFKLSSAYEGLKK